MIACLSRLISSLVSFVDSESSAPRRSTSRAGRPFAGQLELLEPRQLLAATPILYWHSADLSAADAWSLTAKNWNTAGDGSGKQTAWINGANAVFVYNPGVTIQIQSSVTAGSILIEGDGVAITGGKLVLSGSATINLKNDASIDSVIAGSRGLTVAGTATLTLTADNTYTGATRIQGLSTLQIGTSGDNGSLKSTLILNDGTLALFYNSNVTFSQSIRGNGGLNLLGPATVTLRGNNNFYGITTVDAGGLVLANTNALNHSVLQINDLATFSFGTLTAAKIGSLLGDQDLVLENTKGKAVALTLNNGIWYDVADVHHASYSGHLSGLGSLTVSSYQTLTEFCNYKGGTSIQGGYLTLSGNCTSLASLTMSNQKDNAWLDINTSVTIGAFAGGGAVVFEDIGTLVVGFDNRNVTYAGALWGGGRLVKVGAGTLTLTGSTQYFHGTIQTVDGVVKFGYKGTSVSTDMHLQLDGGSINFGTLTSMRIAGLVGSGDLVLANEKHKPVELQVAVNAGTDLFSGVISGSGSLIKSSFGTLRLTGQNTYTGNTTIINGTLQVDGSIASTIRAGSGILTGTGKVHQISIADQSGLRMYGQNQLDNLVLYSTGLQVAINGDTAGDYTHVTVSGVIVLGDSSLSIMENSPRTVATGQAFVIVDNTSSSSIIGTFRGLAEGAIVDVDDLHYRISYVGGDGNDITLTDVM